MSEIGKTTRDGTEFRTDGSKVATEDDPSGDTETQAIQRKQRLLPNGGRSPDYGPEDETDIVAPSPPTGA